MVVSATMNHLSQLESIGRQDMNPRMPRATPWLPAFLLVLGIGAWKIAESAAPPARHPTTAPATRPWNNSTFADPENAKQIIFMCDASGSMINKFASLKNELNKAILELPPNCTFNILFFQDGKAVMLNRNAMVAATQEGKRAASKLLEEVTTTSTSDPIQGLIAGFRLHPDLIYVLTDGDFPDNDAVIKKVRQLNRPA